MSASLTKLMAGTSTKYFTSTVEDVVTDHGGGMSTYYNTPGTPPGEWMGHGLDVINRTEGNVATKLEVNRVYDNLVHPDTERRLTRSSRKTIEEGNAVAGYDLTFTLPKSVNILWASGDPHVRSTIMRCHKEAVKESLEWFESKEAYSRTGEAGIVKQQAKGIIAVAFTHWDSRDGDPHLHDHILISNIVKRSDNKTGALDGKALYSATVAISEQHTNLFMDKLTDALGVQWRQRTMPGTKSSVYDLVGIDDELIDQFSQRNSEIKALYEKEVAKLVDAGIKPDKDTLWKIQNRAWRKSRKVKPKNPKTLHTLMDEWDEKLTQLGYDGKTIVENTTEQGGLCQDISTLLETPNVVHEAHNLIKGQQLPDDKMKPAQWLVSLLSDSIKESTALQSQAEKNPQYAIKTTNPFEALHKETAYNTTTISENVIRSSAERLTRGIRLRPGQRAKLTSMLVKEEENNLVLLNPGRYEITDDLSNDQSLTLKGERAITDSPEGNVYATVELLAAEKRLKSKLHNKYEISEKWTENTLKKEIEVVEKKNKYENKLAGDQRTAVINLLTSEKTIVGLAGPAGTGKTTTLRCLADLVGETSDRRVVAYAPTAVAAQELGSSLGVPADTLARLLFEDQHGNIEKRLVSLQEEYDKAGAKFRESIIRKRPLSRIFKQHDNRKDIRQRIAELKATQENLTIPEKGIVIVDEAGMTNTFDLQHLAELCELKQAKIILVGDDKQLNTVGGGAGAFHWLLNQKDTHFELNSIWRFNDQAEAARSLRLRNRDQNKRTKDYIALKQYKDAGRVHEGQSEYLESYLIKQIAKDYDNGTNSLLIVGSNEGIAEMNEQISRIRQEAGTVERDPINRVVLADGSTAGQGDVICTRSNNRLIKTRKGQYVKNSDLWIIDSTQQGAITCHPIKNSSDSVILPQSYVDKNVIGGYAITPHRSQGKTVDRGYYYIPTNQEGISSANTLYVAMTRGKKRNDVYVGIKSLEEMKVGAEDTYEMAAWRQRNKTRFEKVEEKKLWDTSQGPKPDDKHWYTEEDLLPTPEQQAMWTLHTIMEHTQTSRLASQWAEDYQTAIYGTKRLTNEWNSYLQILSERQLGQVVDKETLNRLSAEPGYNKLLLTYGHAMQKIGPDLVNSIVVHSLNGSADDIKNVLQIEIRIDDTTLTKIKPYEIKLAETAPEDQQNVADLLQQTYQMFNHREELRDKHLNWDSLFREEHAPWMDTIGICPPFGSPRTAEYYKLISEISEYRLIKGIKDPNKPFGGTDYINDWEKDLRKQILAYQQKPTEDDILDKDQDKPIKIPMGKTRAVKAGRDILLDYTSNTNGNGKIRISVTEQTANGIVNQIRNINSAAPSKIVARTEQTTDMAGLWKGLTPKERGQVKVVQSGSTEEPLWKAMIEQPEQHLSVDQVRRGLDAKTRLQVDTTIAEDTKSIQRIDQEPIEVKSQSLDGPSLT